MCVCRCGAPIGEERVSHRTPRGGERAHSQRGKGYKQNGHGASDDRTRGKAMWLATREGIVSSPADTPIPERKTEV